MSNCYRMRKRRMKLSTVDVVVTTMIHNLNSRLQNRFNVLRKTRVDSIEIVDQYFLLPLALSPCVARAPLRDSNAPIYRNDATHVANGLGFKRAEKLVGVTDTSAFVTQASSRTCSRVGRCCGSAPIMDCRSLTRLSLSWIPNRCASP